MTSHEDNSASPRKDALSEIIRVKGSKAPALSPRAELFSLTSQAILNSRSNDWMESIAEDLESLEKQVPGFNAEIALHNPVFFTSFLEAAEIAIRTHQEEKLEALRNAVMNAALQSAPEDAIQLILLNLIDGLTALHIRVLMFLDDPSRYIARNNIKGPGSGGITNKTVSIYTWLEWPFPELRGQEALAKRVVLDLLGMQLLTGADIFPYYSYAAHHTHGPLTTDWGKQLIKFINSPIRSE
jgi:hypothetical protein